MFVDYDGTLAPIVDDPDAARPVAGAPEALAALAARFARVAVISGRPVAYLARHVAHGAPGVQLIGLYGLERAVGDRVVQQQVALKWKPAVDDAAGRAAAAAPPGVSIEHKDLAVTLHYRGADEQAGWTAGYAADLAASSGLVAHPGKKSWELRPPVAMDKGAVVEELARGLDAACFVGDDVGDLPAFQTLARLRDVTGLATLAVAVSGPEAPGDLLAVADAVVDGPAGVLSLLRTLAGP